MRCFGGFDGLTDRQTRESTLYYVKKKISVVFFMIDITHTKYMRLFSLNYFILEQSKFTRKENKSIHYATLECTFFTFFLEFPYFL